ncbi:MAG: hypothetical protein IIB57_14660 [Planctomycetes bacterium]|nr:hypothetical protein [Planctomycetota bacterium]
MLGTGALAGGFVFGPVFYGKARDASRGVGLAKVALVVLVLEALVLVAHISGVLPFSFGTPPTG